MGVFPKMSNRGPFLILFLRLIKQVLFKSREDFYKLTTLFTLYARSVVTLRVQNLNHRSLMHSGYSTGNESVKREHTHTHLTLPHSSLNNALGIRRYY